MEMLQIVLTIVYIVLAVLTFGYLLLRKRNSYWSDRGIIHDPPNLLFGNTYAIGRTKQLRETIFEFYQKYKHVASFAGYYLFLRRAVVLFDLDLIKNVMIKDFSSFAYRGNYYNEKDDPLTAHLFNLDGPSWRSMRIKLTPAFTSGKMKFMFPSVVEVAEKFVTVMQHLNETGTAISGEKSSTSGIEIKEMLARFTTDVIGSCIFGLEYNCLTEPNSKFRLMGKAAFMRRRHNTFILSIMNAYPNLARKLGMKSLPEDINQFFMKVVRETVTYREREKIQRNDFMNLLLELKNRNDGDGLTIEQIAAQSILFFLAGYETSASTMAFALYELALNQDIQDEARKEINDMLLRYDNQFTYEGLYELKYLKKVLYETMRLYSVASLILRKTVEDYKIPGTNYVIEKGITVVIPIDAIHRDPEIYPNPEKFDPTRFEQSEIKKRHPMAWLPFGEGPRNCIGLRFGEMQSLIGLVVLLRNFKVTPSKETPIPMEYNVKSFILAPKDGIVLKFEKL